MQSHAKVLNLNQICTMTTGQQCQNTHARTHTHPQSII